MFENVKKKDKSGPGGGGNYASVPTSDPFAAAAKALQAANFRCGTPKPVKESEYKLAYAWPRLADEAQELISRVLSTLGASGVDLARRAGLEGLLTTLQARRVEIAFRDLDSNEWKFESDLSRKFALGKQGRKW